MNMCQREERLSKSSETVELMLDGLTCDEFRCVFVKYLFLIMHDTARTVGNARLNTRKKRRPHHENTDRGGTNHTRYI